MTCRPREPQGEFLMSIKVFQDGDVIVVEQDFARSPRGWPSIYRGVEAVIEKLQKDVANQNGCPARPKGGA